MRSFALTLILALTWPIAAHAELRAKATQTELTITGASGKARLAVCRVGNQRIDGVETMLGQQTVVTADDAGAATVPATVGALRAIWLAVDLTSGAYVIATPPGFEPRTIAPPVLTRQGAGAGKAFRWSRPVVDVWIAGKKGIWHGAAASGTMSEDERGADGTVSFNLNRLERNENDHENDGAPPLVFTPGDVILAVDPGWMVYAVITVPKGNNGAN
jgi:hypothetical protein